MTQTAVPPTQSASQIDAPTRRRAVVAAGTGQAVEFFEFTIYGAVVPYISHIFFPSADVTATVLATWAVFAVAFFARPIGAYFWGSLGDRLGRRGILTTVILIMAAATIAIGLVPGYATIGLAAPLILIFLRVVQGFSAGGEATGASAYIAEIAHPEHRARTMSAWQIASFIGVFGATLMTNVLVLVWGEEVLSGGGWRVLFIIAGCLGLIGLYLRKKLPETPEFAELESAGETSKRPLREAWANHKKEMLIVAGLAMNLNFGFYFALIYLPTMMKSVLGISPATITIATIVAIVISIFVCRFAGSAADRFGRRPLMILGAGLGMVCAVPSLMLMSAGVAGAIVAMTVMASIIAIYNSVFPTVMTELFPAGTRYSATSLVYGTAVAVFGGGGPYLSAWLLAVTGTPVAPFVLASAIAAISLVVAIFWLPETAPGKTGKARATTTP